MSKDIMSKDMEILSTAFEILALRKKLTNLAWSESERIKDIAGNEIAKRAIEVAAVHGISIGFFGREVAHRLTLVAAGFGVPAFAAKPCPCGRYGSMRESCRCSISVIRRHQNSKEFQTALGADMLLEVDEYATVPNARNEEAAAIMARVKKAKEFEKEIIDAPEYAMTDDAKNMLRVAADTLELTTARVDLVKNLARCSMVLEGVSTIIHAHHIAEACSYIRRPYRL